tara:strand:+ start:653 stop:832 length:180 start_codon:yes stop_codon:yes gene_type:complete
VFLDFKYCSSKYITQGSNANANISGLYTNLIDIDGGKKLINNRVGKMTFNEKFILLSKK